MPVSYVLGSNTALLYPIVCLKNNFPTLGPATKNLRYGNYFLPFEGAKARQAVGNFHVVQSPERATTHSTLHGR